MENSPKVLYEYAAVYITSTKTIKLYTYAKLKIAIHYLFTIKTLVEYNADRPDVNFGGNFWRLFTNNKTFWRQVPAI